MPDVTRPTDAPRRRRRPRRAEPAGRLAFVVAALALLAGACTNGDDGSAEAPDDTAQIEAPEDEEPERTFAFDGPDDGAVVNAESLPELRFLATADDGAGHLDDVAIHLDDEDVTSDATIDGGELVYEPTTLEDGDHVVRVVLLEAAEAGEAGANDGGNAQEGDAATDDAADGDTADGDTTDGDAAHDDTTDAGEDPALEGQVLHEWRFEVDATPPELEVELPDTAVVADDPVTITGTSEPDATVHIHDDETVADADGAFELELSGPPDGEFEIAAVDAAGNRSEPHTAELVTVPSRVALDEIRGVHVTSHAWAHPDFRERILRMVDEGRINTVQLDLKDEGGRIGFDTEVELANETGAAESVYDLSEAVEELHGRGIHIVGRIVAFRDPVLGAYAQDTDQMDWLIQTPEGEPYTGRYPCCFTSFASDDVIDYHLDIAEEAAAAGVDDILWDYIRRPDGSPDNMVVPGVSDDADGATLEEAVVDFARRADERLAHYGVGHGASLYGIAADRPTQIAQDVPALAEHLDYVAPMIYPSHWGPGEYGVAEPIRQPYDIITATLEVWQEATDGRRARVVPWLEDTNYRAWDRPHQVREQLRATYEHGIEEWLMWDPVVNYTVDAYEPRD